jgi:hypothetical protein
MDALAAREWEVIVLRHTLLQWIAEARRSVRTFTRALRSAKGKVRDLVASALEVSGAGGAGRR